MPKAILIFNVPDDCKLVHATITCSTSKEDYVDGVLYYPKEINKCIKNFEKVKNILDFKSN